jgi:hypothetical protein
MDCLGQKPSTYQVSSRWKYANIDVAAKKKESKYNKSIPFITLNIDILIKETFLNIPKTSINIPIHSLEIKLVDADSLKQNLSMVVIKKILRIFLFIRFNW